MKLYDNSYERAEIFDCFKWSLKLTTMLVVKIQYFVDGNIKKSSSFYIVRMYIPVEERYRLSNNPF